MSGASVLGVSVGGAVGGGVPGALPGELPAGGPLASWLDWALGLPVDGLSFVSGAQLGYERGLPDWAWLVVCVAAAAVAAVSYARLTTPVRTRAVLAVLRAGAVVLLAWLATGPRLERAVERVEPDWLVMLVDRSRSMLAPADRDAGVTRDDQAVSAIAAAAGVLAESAAGSADGVDVQRRVLWLGFAGGVSELGGVPAALAEAAGAEGALGEALSGPRRTALGEALGDAVGDRTAIASAVSEALRRVAGRPVGGVVVLSDGRSLDRPTGELLARLEQQRVSVHTVRLGSPGAVSDSAVLAVESPGAAFVGDVVTVSADVRLGGGEAVELVDRASGEVLDRWEPAGGAAGGGGRERVTLRTRPGGSGRFEWSVRVVPGGEDLAAENNERALVIELVDTPLRVVYFDGYPRWERRYLTSALVREPLIDVASLILASDRAFLQESDTALEGVPTTAEGWAGVDVVVIGDVRPELLGERVMSAIAEHVAEGGAGLLWLLGPATEAGAWASTPLGSLVPVAGSRGGGSWPVWGEPVVMRGGEEAEGSWGLSIPGEGHEAGWPRLRWAARVDGRELKPGAEVLAAFESAGGESSPGVVSMRFGAGLVAMVATDEVWRWRFGVGTGRTERFWTPLIRTLARARASRAGRSAVFEAQPSPVAPGEAVRLTLTLVDQLLIDSAPASFEARVVGPDGVDVGRVPLVRERGSSARVSSGVASVDRPGRYVAVVDAGVVSEGAIEAEFEVIAPDDESAELTVDHGMLAELSRATGGRSVGPGELSEVIEGLPRRSVIVAGEPETVTLWDRPAVLVVLIVLLGAEWMVRRLVRLA